MPRFYHWDGIKLTGEPHDFGEKPPDCSDLMHHFRRVKCQCGEKDLTEIRLATAQREADA